MQPAQESLIQYPCHFPIKVMGAALPEFEQCVFDIILRHAPDTSQDAFQKRFSNGARYLAITVVVEAQNREQLDSIYNELTACELVVMAL